MAFAINITTFERTGEDSFSATGTLGEKSFVAQTILYGPKDNRAPIFKVVENREGEVSHQRMADSQFSRGERIALARSLKSRRLAYEADEAAAGTEVELTKLTLKQLRSRARELGVRGTHRKGIRKDEVVALVASA